MHITIHPSKKLKSIQLFSRQNSFLYALFDNTSFGFIIVHKRSAILNLVSKLSITLRKSKHQTDSLNRVPLISLNAIRSEIMSWINFSKNFKENSFIYLHVIFGLEEKKFLHRRSKEWVFLELWLFWLGQSVEYRNIWHHYTIF